MANLVDKSFDAPDEKRTPAKTTVDVVDLGDAAGWAAPWAQFRRVVVGVGMIPRGEVGLIFADIGRRAGILNEAVFGAILLMVMATTFIAPPGLKLLFGARTSDTPTT